MNHVDKPNSVECNHLSGSGIATTLERHFSTVNSRDTALHAGKDLAVSLLRFRKILPEGSLCFSARASLLAPLATHSVDATGVTRYLSVFVNKHRRVRTFLPAFAERLPNMTNINYITNRVKSPINLKQHNIHRRNAIAYFLCIL